MKQDKCIDATVHGNGRERKENGLCEYIKSIFYTFQNKIYSGYSINYLYKN